VNTDSSKALRYGTRSQVISKFYLHTPRSSANGMNHTCLCFQPKLVFIYRPRRDRRLSWPWVAGWLHTEINVRPGKLNPSTIMGYMGTLGLCTGRGISCIVLFCCTVHYCLFSLLIFGLLATSSINWIWIWGTPSIGPATVEEIR